MRKLFRIVILFCLVLALGGCAPKSKGEEYIYITHQTYHEWQIWKVAIDGSESEMLYQIPVWISTDSPEWDEYFSDDIRHQLEEEYESATRTIFFRAYADAMVSPDKTLLAIGESVSQFPIVGYSHAQSSLRIFNLETNEEIFQYLTRHPAGISSWSNDSSLFTLSQLEQPYKDGFGKTHVWDLQAGEEIFTASGTPLTFIGNSYKVLAKYYIDNQGSYITSSVCCQVFDPSTGVIETKPIAELSNHYFYYGSPLSSDGKKIALIAPLENGVEIKIADFDSLEVEENFYLGNAVDRAWDIGWSPDDKLIAVKGERNEEHFLDVIDSESGDVLYSLGRVSDWQWSSKENKILYFTENHENYCIQKDIAINILDMRDGTITPIELPEEIQDYIDSNDNDIICIRYISDVSW